MYNCLRQQGYIPLASRCSSAVEHRFRKAAAVGSNPTTGSFLFPLVTSSTTPILKAAYFHWKPLATRYIATSIFLYE